jgi:SET domain-containing protein
MATGSIKFQPYLTMLLINASKGPSAIHGIGLIAREFISKGQTIWEYHQSIDHFIPVQKLKELSKWAREQVIWYGFYNHLGIILSGDDDRFTNHSLTPNSGFKTELSTVALRDIQTGEEITMSYSLIIEDELIEILKL